MPNVQNAKRIFGRNADSYCPILDRMLKTGESRNASVSMVKKSSAYDRVCKRLLLGSFGAWHMFRVHNKS